MATIAEMLIAKGQLRPPVENPDDRWYRAGARAKCVVTPRTGKNAKTLYGRTKDAAWSEAYDYACNQGWNIPACTFATYRLVDPAKRAC